MAKRIRRNHFQLDENGELEYNAGWQTIEDYEIDGLKDLLKQKEDKNGESKTTTIR